MKFYYSLQKLKYDNSYQIATGVILELYVFGQPPHNHHVRCSEPCEHFAQNA